MNVSKRSEVLVVEDDLALQKQIKWSLDRFECLAVADRESALAQFRRARPPVVTMDLGLPPDADSVSEGFRLLQELLQIDPDVKLIVLTGQNDRTNALRAVDLGAYDFLAKPLEAEVLNLTVERALRLYELQRENARLRELAPSDLLGDVITRDPKMTRICRTIDKVAPSTVTVMLLGESGTGKEVLAQRLHHASRRHGRFVPINCAAIPENLLESELFGYERGAFTGALGAKPGLLEAADGGTVFLDEIGELPLPLQAKLLRVVELREVTRVGALRPRRIDVRFVAATNRDLEQAIATGQFRQDLYYRLNGVSLSVPPLRERSNEIEPLARLFLEEACARFAVDVPALSAAALSALQGYAWPGNVRELRNAIDRAVLLATERVIEPKHLGLPLHDPGPRRHTSSDELGPDAPERERILRGLEACGGNQSRAADLLGIPRRTLVRRIAQLGLRRPRGTNE
jgi:two-component system NtrC family response regulator